MSISTKIAERELLPLVLFPGIEERIVIRRDISMRNLIATMFAVMEITSAEGCPQLW